MATFKRWRITFVTAVATAAVLVGAGALIAGGGGDDGPSVLEAERGDDRQTDGAATDHQRHVVLLEVRLFHGV